MAVVSTNTVVTAKVTGDYIIQDWVTGVPPSAIYSAPQDGNLLALDVTAQIVQIPTISDANNRLLGYRLTIWKDRVRANATADNLTPFAIDVTDVYDISGLIYDGLITRMGITQLRFPPGMIQIKANSTYLFILSKNLLYDETTTVNTIKHVGGFSYYIEPAYHGKVEQVKLR